MAEDPFTPRNMPWLRRDAMNGIRLDAQLRANERDGLPKNGTAPLEQDDIEVLARLRTAELFWISPDMSELCHDATSDLSEVHLGRDLWPAETGLMVFATSVPVEGFAWKNANDASLEPIRAVLWYPEKPAKATGNASLVTVLLFTDLRAMVEATVHRLHDGDIDPARVARGLASFSGFGMSWLASAGGDSYRIDVPLSRLRDDIRPAPLAGANADAGAVSDLDRAGQDEDREGANVRDSDCPAGVMLSTVWLLMGQRGLAKTATGVPIPRNKAAARRQQAVQGELDGVRIIEIRAGTDHAAAYASATRTHRHRWMVKGHWRQQYYRSLGANRPVWIAPYLKGPRDAPLLTGQKVHTWKGR